MELGLAVRPKGFKRAIDLNPKYASTYNFYSIALAILERYEEAITLIQKALELDPLSPGINSIAGWVFYFARQYDRAIEQGRRTVSLDPSFAGGHHRLGMAFLQQGMHEEAVASFEEAINLSDGSPMMKAVLGVAYALSNNRDAANNVLAELEQLSRKRYVSPYDKALVCAGLDEKEKALEYLQKSYEEHSQKLVMLQVEPILDPLRDDSRFQDLLLRMNLEP